MRSALLILPLLAAMPAARRTALQIRCQDDPSVGRSERFQDTGTSDGGAWHGQNAPLFLL